VALLKTLLQISITIKRVDLLFLLHGPSETNSIIIFLFNLGSLSLCLSLRINCGSLVFSTSLLIICPRTATSFYYISIKCIIRLPSPPPAAALLLFALSLIIIIIINKMFKKREKPNNYLKRTNEDRYHNEDDEKEDENQEGVA
jgi:hypothetical protein